MITALLRQMNKYLIVDLLPSEWNKVSQWLLTALPKTSAKVNKLSLDLLEDKISTSLRKTPKHCFATVDAQQALELVEMVLAPRTVTHSSTQTETTMELSTIQRELVLTVNSEAQDEKERLLTCLSEEVTALKETLALRDAEILRNQHVDFVCEPTDDPNAARFYHRA